MSSLIWRRILWEQRVRLPLILAFALAWGFLLVTLFGHLSPQERSLGPQEVQIALRLLGIDALAAWVTVGQEHPAPDRRRHALPGRGRGARHRGRARGRDARAWC